MRPRWADTDFRPVYPGEEANRVLRYDEDGEPELVVPVYRDGWLHVKAERCETCIFRPGNPMQLNEGRVRQMVDECLASMGGHVTCHDTLDGDRAVCRGYWDGYRDRDVLLSLAERTEIVREVQ